MTRIRVDEQQGVKGFVAAVDTGAPIRRRAWVAADPAVFWVTHDAISVATFNPEDILATDWEIGEVINSFDEPIAPRPDADPRTARVLALIDELWSMEDGWANAIKSLLGHVDWSAIGPTMMRRLFALLMSEQDHHADGTFSKLDEQRRDDLFSAAEREHAMNCLCCAKRIARAQ